MPRQNDNVTEFFNPKSMITPGAAGAITMAIANTLWIQFDLEQRWVALVLSFGFGMVVFVGRKLPIWQRSVYYVINSLIIFTVAVGSNSAGVTLGNSQTVASTLSALPTISLLRSAHAGDDQGRQIRQAVEACSDRVSGQDEVARCARKRLAGPDNTLDLAVVEAIEERVAKTTGKRSFFKPWF